VDELELQADAGWLRSLLASVKADRTGMSGAISLRFSQKRRREMMIDVKVARDLFQAQESTRARRVWCETAFRFCHLLLQ